MSCRAQRELWCRKAHKALLNMARYPSKVTTGGQALTLQENSTRGNDVGCSRQRPPRPSTSSWLSSCYLFLTQVATLLAWIFGWATSSSGYFENSTWSNQQFQCIQPSVTRWGQQGQPWWRLHAPHAAPIEVAVGVTIGIILIVSCCCYFCCRSLLALA